MTPASQATLTSGSTPDAVCPDGDTVAYSARWNPETIGVSGFSR